ncbi:hypothetical protein [Corynebacterium resistens]|uniref:hypothetical protein n=1 Tax=Corynebacterium resistens TaxID=258224 RepID=UPI0001E289B8|nr:hypothetical protein [Corynebacterium resistens]
MGAFHLIAALIALLTVGARAFQLSQRGLFWDDLVIPAFYSGFNPVGSPPPATDGSGTSGKTSAFTPPATSDAPNQFSAEQLSTAIGKSAPNADSSLLERLFSPYDGHLMPGSGAVQLAVAHVAPLSWWLPAVSILLTTMVTTALWYVVVRRAIHLGASPRVALVIFAGLCTSPFLSAAAGWWSASLNALAWQLAAAAIALVGLRPAIRPRTMMVSFVAIQLGALLFTEKALSLIAVTALVVWARVQRERRPQLFALLIGPFMLTVGWAALYLSVVDFHTAEGGFAVTSAIPKALVTVIIPGMLGGPWVWDRWHPGSPFGNLPLGVGLIVTTLVLATLTLAGWRSVRSRAKITRRVFWTCSCVAGSSLAYLAVVLVFMIRARTSSGTTDLLPRTAHYYADWWTFTLIAVLVAAIVLSGLSGRSQDFSVRRPTPHPSPFAVGLGPTIAATLLAISASVSTVTWTVAWRDDPTGQYLSNLQRTVVSPHAKGLVPPLLNQPARIDVLNPLLHPYNSVNALTGIPVATHTTQPKVVNANGELVDAGVLKVASNKQGSDPQCGTRITAGQPKLVMLDQPLAFGDWTWEFNAAATSDTNVRITMPNGLQSSSEVAKRAVTVPVGTKPETRWVRLNGVGGTIAVTVVGSPGTSVCLGQGAIGPLLPAHRG